MAYHSSYRISNGQTAKAMSLSTLLSNGRMTGVSTIQSLLMPLRHSIFHSRCRPAALLKHTCYINTSSHQPVIQNYMEWNGMKATRDSVVNFISIRMTCFLVFHSEWYKKRVPISGFERFSKGGGDTKTWNYFNKKCNDIKKMIFQENT